jgi:hypothetical protein
MNITLTILATTVVANTKFMHHNSLLGFMVPFKTKNKTIIIFLCLLQIFNIL